jgi:uncharacterized protein YndB with AHSA1/START domain
LIFHSEQEGFPSFDPPRRAQLYLQGGADAVVGRVVHCEMLEIDLHKRLRYSWRSGPESSRLDTVVTWTLTPTQSGGTRLVLEHSGFLPGFAFDGAK